MDRRRFLTAATAGLTWLAGCQGVGSQDTPERDPYDVPETPETDTTTADPGRPRVVLPPEEARRSRTVGGGSHRVAVARSVTGTDVTGTSLTVGLTAPATPESPARVWIDLMNGGSSTRKLSLGATPPFAAYRGSAAKYDPDVFLVPVDAGDAFDYPIPDAPTDGTWIATWSPPAPRDRTTEVALGPGESVAREYYLLLTHAASSYPDRAVYQFGPDAGGVTVGLSVWNPDRVDRPGSSFSRSVPDLPVGDLTAWYHRSGRPAFLAPASERLAPSDRTTFALTNLSGRPLAAGADAWQLYRYRSGWERVAGGDASATSVFRRVPVGGVRSLSLSLGDDPSADASSVDRSSRDGGSPADGDPPDGSREAATAAVDELDPGLYALQFGAATTGAARGPVTVHGDETYAWTPPPDPDTGEFDGRDGEMVAFAALFRVSESAARSTPGSKTG